ncbi:MAG: RcpC/CpaB family pilus assembly protein [Phycisphaerales bacterium]
MAQTPNTNAPPGSNRLVIIAAVIAVVAVIVVNLYVAMIKRQVHEGEFTVYRLVTTLKPGDKLASKDVKAVPMPRKYRDSFDGMVLEESGEGDASLTAQVGLRIKLPARRNQFLTYDLFTDPSDIELDTRINPNMRLVALPVNPRTLPGSLQPGMSVDIEAQFPGGNLNILPVMENVEVFSVGTRSIADDSTDAGRATRNFTTISLQVTPDEATNLEKIKKMVIGDFELHLRNPSDNSTPKIPDGGINPAVLRLIER